MSLRVGASVRYDGPDRAHDGLHTGDMGRLLLLNGGTSHVRWNHGAILAVYTADLSSAGHTAAAVDAVLDESLDVGGDLTFGLRHLCSMQGPQAVYSSLLRTGALGGDLNMVAQQTVAFVDQQMRETPAMVHAAAELDPADLNSLIHLAVQDFLRQLAAPSPDDRCTD